MSHLSDRMDDSSAAEVDRGRASLDTLLKAYAIPSDITTEAKLEAVERLVREGGMPENIAVLIRATLLQ